MTCPALHYFRKVYVRAFFNAVIEIFFIFLIANAVLMLILQNWEPSAILGAFWSALAFGSFKFLTCYSNCKKSYKMKKELYQLNYYNVHGIILGQYPHKTRESVRNKLTRLMILEEKHKVEYFENLNTEIMRQLGRL